MRFKSLVGYILKKYVSDWLPNIVRAVLTLGLALLAIQAKEQFKDFPNPINWKAAGLIFCGYLVVDFIAKFIEEFRHVKNAYDGILDSMLNDFNRNLHEEITKNVAFRITLFLQKNESGKKKLIIHKRLNGSETKKSKTKWVVDSSDITLCEGIVGEAWFNPGSIIKKSFQKKYLDVKDNASDLKKFAKDIRMSVSAVEERAKNKSKFSFPLSIVAYASELRDGERFVLTIDTDQKKCNISKNAEKVIKDHSRILTYVLKH